MVFQNLKTPGKLAACYHLVTIKTARRLQLFAAIRGFGLMPRLTAQGAASRQPS
jgi:hypothetical protein